MESHGSDTMLNQTMFMIRFLCLPEVSHAGGAGDLSENILPLELSARRFKST